MSLGWTPSKSIRIYTTDSPMATQGGSYSYKGLIVANKVMIATDVTAPDKLLTLICETRSKLLDEAKEAAVAMGANAILGLKMKTNAITNGTLEMLVYGTAVYVIR